VGVVICLFCLNLKVVASDQSRADQLLQMAADADQKVDSEKRIRISDSLTFLALDLYKKAEDYSGIIECYNNMLVSAFSRGDNYKAREYAGKALVNALKGGLKHQTALAYSNLSVVSSRMGDLELANEYNFKALNIFTKDNDTVQIARCNLSIGTVYIQMHEYTKALGYIKTAKDSFFKAGDELGYSISLTNLGSAFMSLKRYNEALPNFYEALSIDEKDGDKRGMSSNYINIGKIYHRLHNDRQSEEFYQKASEIVKTTGDISVMASLNIQLARLKFDQKKIDTALIYAKRSLKLYTEAGELSGKQSAMVLLSEIYSVLGESSHAFDYYREAMDLKDSLFTVEKAAKLAVLEEKFINERLLNENMSLQFINHTQKAHITTQRRITYTIIGGLIFAITGFVIITVQLRKKNSAYRFLVRKNLVLMERDAELQNARMQLMKVEPLAEEPEKAKYTLDGEEKERLLQRLDKVIKVEKAYTKTDLTIDKLAKKLATNRTYLSQLINDVYNKSYSDYINEHRVNESMRLLSDPSTGSKFSIEAIAREAGFNTISNFNTVFRKQIGITPSLFRKNADSQTVESI